MEMNMTFTILFCLAATVATASALLAVTRTNAVHALLNLLVSLLATAFVFLLLGASFAAALEVIVYAGAIMILFVFVIMLQNRGADDDLQERQWLDFRAWRMPA